MWKMDGEEYGSKITLEPFERILSGYRKVEELAVNVTDCSKLAQNTQDSALKAID